MNSMLAFLNGPEVIAILVVVLILFGAKKLPELARGLGQGLKEFKKSTREVQDEMHAAMEVDSTPAPAPKRAITPAVEAQVHPVETQPVQPAQQAPKA